MTDFRRLLETLTAAGVEFILVGGAAAVAHGSTRLTLDIDIVYRRTPRNMQKLAAALAPLSPYLRGAPAGLPFRFDAQTIERGLNFTLQTSLGWIGLLGEITGGGRFEDVQSHCVRLSVYGVECLCIDLPHLIQVKRAAGRPKDFEVIAELEAILEEQRQDKGG